MEKKIWITRFNNQRENFWGIFQTLTEAKYQQKKVKETLGVDLVINQGKIII